MKKLIFIALLIVLAGVAYLSVKKLQNEINSVLSEQVQTPSSPDAPLKLTGNGDLTGSETIFVPYWSLDNTSEIPSRYNRLVYFAVTPGTNGLDTSESGYTDLSLFRRVSTKTAAKIYLALSMTDTTQNFAILENKKRQQALINDTLKTAQDNGFSGVVVDLELQALPFDSLVGQINTFIADFSDAAQERHLAFAQTFYGDTFYRLRPFDIKSLTKSGDEVMIMAYDFHKAKGSPGPNFPLGGEDTYGYDMEEMIQDFLKIVPSNKITVVFGMFGYDWKVNGSGASLDTANPLTDTQISQKFLNGCQYADCKVMPDSVSKETKITYKDTDSVSHIVWFEDAASVVKKQMLLAKYHIGSFGYWAYSYF